MHSIVAAVLLSALILPVEAVAQGLAPTRKDEAREKLEKGDPEAKLREQVALAKVKRDAFLAGTRAVLSDLDALSAEETGVAAELAALRTNDAGRAVGADEKQRGAFSKIESHPRLRPEEISTRRDGLKQLAKVVEDNGATDTSVYTPSSEMTAQLDSERQWVAQKLAAARADRSALRGVAASASPPPAGSNLPTLAEALEQARAADLAGKAGEEANHQDEIQRAREKARREAELRAAQLERDARDPSVLKEFDPLLQHTFKTLSGGHVAGGDGAWPPSMKELQRLNVMTDVNKFYYYGNFRGGAQWPETEPMDAKKLETLTKRMERFRELAPLWVKQGKLRR